MQVIIYKVVTEKSRLEAAQKTIEERLNSNSNYELFNFKKFKDYPKIGYRPKYLNWICFVSLFKNISIIPIDPDLILPKDLTTINIPSNSQTIRGLIVEEPGQLIIQSEGYLENLFFFYPHDLYTYLKSKEGYCDFEEQEVYYEEVIKEVKNFLTTQNKNFLIFVMN